MMIANGKIVLFGKNMVYQNSFSDSKAYYTKSHFGLSKWLREHALWQPLPGRQ
jgi:hypothetical protein